MHDFIPEAFRNTGEADTDRATPRNKSTHVPKNRSCHPGDWHYLFLGRSSGLPSSFSAPSHANTVAKAESSGLQQRGLRRNYHTKWCTGFPFQSAMDWNQ